MNEWRNKRMNEWTNIPNEQLSPRPRARTSTDGNSTCSSPPPLPQWSESPLPPPTSSIPSPSDGSGRRERATRSINLARLSKPASLVLAEGVTKERTLVLSFPSLGAAKRLAAGEDHAREAGGEGRARVGSLSGVRSWHPVIGYTWTTHWKNNN